MNLPNKLTILRVIMIPFFVAALLYDGGANQNMRYVAAALFIIASLTDMLDGKIARKYGLITDFGKFIDPLADKFMVFGLLIAILTANLYEGIRPVFVWVAAVVILRELGVTSLRLVVASRGVVVPASWWGKIKTVTQICALVVILMEPALTHHLAATAATTSFNIWYDGHLAAALAMGAMTFTTVGSGLDYLTHLWPYVAGKK